MKVVVAAEEKDIGVMQQHTQAMAEEAKADLAEAMPALQAAIDSLKALNKNDITEVSPVAVLENWWLYWHTILPRLEGLTATCVA